MLQTIRKMNKGVLEQIKAETSLEEKMSKQKAGFFAKHINSGQKKQKAKEKRKIKYEMTAS